MIDATGRDIDHIRISLTNRCNLDCFYCHKEGNLSDEEMDTSYVKNLLGNARSLGISEVKFTGGEPLLREDICEIIEKAVSLGFSYIGLTTNGTLLEEKAHLLREAGLKRVNIGCDSIGDALPKNAGRLKKGILSARQEGMSVKLNMVILKGINDSQVEEMLGFCRKNKVNLQLIELMPDKDTEHLYMPLDEIEHTISMQADITITRKMQNRKRYFLDGIFIETVRPGTDFCRHCTKIRISCDGKIKECLRKQTFLDYKDKVSLKEAIEGRVAYGYG